MSKMDVLTISESTYDLENGGKGKIAVFIYNGLFDPKPIIDLGYYDLMISSSDNPWVRVVLSDINNMKQEPFSGLHCINNGIK